MSDVRGLLERAQARFPAPDRVMDRLTARRDRKRRNRRILTAVLALALAALALGGLLDTFRAESVRRPASDRSQITPENVTDLRLAWVGLTPHTPGSDEGISVPPVVVGHRVYVDSKGFFLYAFATSCGSGGASCDPLWISLAPDVSPDGVPATAGIGGRLVWPPAAADGRVYQPSIDQAVFAYPASCGSQMAACRPLWAGVIEGIPSTPIVAGDVVYAFAAGTVYAFPTSCGGGSFRCRPLWTGATGETRTRGAAHLAIADGVLYVTVDRAVYAFSTTCLGSPCQPIWHTAHLGRDDEGVRTSPPILGDGVVFVAVGGGSGATAGPDVLAAFPAACGGSCRPLWTWYAPGHGLSDPVVADGTVYITAEGTSRDSRVVAFEEDCGGVRGPCTPEWVAAGRGQPAAADGMVYVDSGESGDGLLAYPARCATGGSTCTTARTYAGASGEPVVAGDVVFVAPMGGQTVLAFDARCAGASGKCAPLWTGTTPGRVRSGPVVTSNGVYVGTSDGKVVAFMLTQDRRDAAAGIATDGRIILVFGVVLVIAAVVVRRRHA